MNKSQNEGNAKWKKSVKKKYKNFLLFFIQKKSKATFCFG